MSMIRIQFGVTDISDCLNDKAIDNTDIGTKWHIFRSDQCGEGDLLLLLMKWIETGPYHLLNDLETALWQDGLC